MKVKDLIEQLQQFDPEMNVIGSCIDPSDYNFKVPIEGVYVSDPYDTHGFSGIDNSEIDYLESYNDNDEYIGVQCVVIDLGNV